MATHDYDIANQSGAAFRTDLNNALAAIQSNNSGSSSPSTTVAYQWWADTNTGTLKIRNSANNAWVELLQLDGTLTLEDGSASTPALAFRDDLDTGIYSSSANTFNIATGGTERLKIDGSTTVFNEDGADVDFRIEGDGRQNLFYVDAGNDRIGINTASPSTNLHVFANTGDCTLQLESSGSATDARINLLGRSNGVAQIRFGDENDANVGLLTYDHSDNSMAFRVNDAERCRINSSGNVGIASTNPTEKLEINLGTDKIVQFTGGIGQIGDVAGLFAVNTAKTEIADFGIMGNTLKFASGTASGGAEVMRFTSDKKVGIGTSSPVNKLEVDNGSSVCFARISTTNTGSGVAGLIISNSSKTAYNDGIKIKHGAGVALVTGLDDTSICRFSPNDGASGNFHVFGALSKGSGSFLIDHPLESKKDTHNLVHSFIEGPQADLIYRGKIALSDGSATVNIDTVSGMTSGTFATLNTNVQCFTNNETGWSAVKGSVSGNILTITAEDNSCSDTISWLVIGERQDQHMKETTWTDNDGKVIVEPLKT